MDAFVLALAREMNLNEVLARALLVHGRGASEAQVIDAILNPAAVASSSAPADLTNASTVADHPDQDFERTP